jgi:omega-6 fatty acid desaturase / acyl-lipid omega-6 desaturase (Delta-12 desaturase)
VGARLCCSVLRQFTLGQIRKAVPPHCFQRSLVKSSLYLVRDLLIVLSLLYMALVGIPALPSPIQHIAAWLYWVAQGCTFFGVWLIAHECGHQAFSDFPLLNDVIGLVAAHTLLLMEVQPSSSPFQHWCHGARRGVHPQEERRTGVVHSVCVRAQQQSGCPAAPPRRAAHCWLANVPGLQHMGPSVSRLCKSLQPLRAQLQGPGARPNSGLRCRRPGHAILPAQPCNQVWFRVCRTYLRDASAGNERLAGPRHVPAPYSPGASPLRLERVGLVTRGTGHRGPRLRQHPQPRVPQHHRHARSAPPVPHYHAVQATKAVRPILADYYQFDSTPILKAIWREVKQCIYVEPQDDDGKGIFWYSNIF